MDDYIAPFVSLPSCLAFIEQLLSLTGTPTAYVRAVWFIAIEHSWSVTCNYTVMCVMLTSSLCYVFTHCEMTQMITEYLKPMVLDRAPVLVDTKNACWPWRESTSKRMHCSTWSQRSDIRLLVYMIPMPQTPMLGQTFSSNFSFFVATSRIGESVGLGLTVLRTEYGGHGFVRRH